MRSVTRAGVLSAMTIRVKLMLAFVAAMGVVLAATGLVLYLRFEAELDGSIDRGLQSQTYAVQALITQADSGLQSGGRGLLRSGQSFAEVLVGGRVTDWTPPLSRRPLLTARQLTLAEHGRLLLRRAQGPGLPGPSRLLASTFSGQNGRATIVVGVLLHDRDSALSELALLLVLGGLGALLCAGAVGFGLATLALRAVDSMRRHAETLSVADPDGRLPVPRARDELWRLGTTLNEMLARSEMAFARERAFVDDASHELRTPLSILRAELEIALRGEESLAELRVALVSAIEETDRLSRLVDDLLILARADQGNLPVRREQVLLAGLLGAVAERRCAQVGAAGRTVTVAASPGLVLEGDRAGLEQALGNLVDNAIRHGTGPIRLCAVRVRDSVELHVTDSGPGLPEGFIAHAFDRFTRADAARGCDGSGLGLSIARSIALAHGGSAAAANRRSGGADVWLTFPLALSHKAAGEITPAAVDERRVTTSGSIHRRVIDRP